MWIKKRKMIMAFVTLISISQHPSESQCMGSWDPLKVTALRNPEYMQRTSDMISFFMPRPPKEKYLCCFFSPSTMKSAVSPNESCQFHAMKIEQEQNDKFFSIKRSKDRTTNRSRDRKTNRRMCHNFSYHTSSPKNCEQRLIF